MDMLCRHIAIFVDLVVGELVVGGTGREYCPNTTIDYDSDYDQRTSPYNNMLCKHNVFQEDMITASSNVVIVTLYNVMHIHG